MIHAEHVALIRGGVPGPGGVWADLGSGAGAFTLALAELIGPGSAIYSVDRDRSVLEQQAAAMQADFPATEVHYLVADFNQPLDLPPLDGVLMANSLHFQRDKTVVLGLVRRYLRPGGRLIIVEYDTAQCNLWLSYPLPYAAWTRLAAECGFVGTRRLATRPSRFHGQLYSALSFAPSAPATTVARW